MNICRWRHRFGTRRRVERLPTRSERNDADRRQRPPLLDQQLLLRHARRHDEPALNDGRRRRRREAHHVLQLDQLLLALLRREEIAPGAKRNAKILQRRLLRRQRLGRVNRAEERAGDLAAPELRHKLAEAPRGGGHRGGREHALDEGRLRDLDAVGAQRELAPVADHRRHDARARLAAAAAAEGLLLGEAAHAHGGDVEVQRVRLRRAEGAADRRASGGVGRRVEARLAKGVLVVELERRLGPRSESVCHHFIIIVLSLSLSLR